MISYEFETRKKGGLSVIKTLDLNQNLEKSDFIIDYTRSIVFSLFLKGLTINRAALS